MKPTLYEALGLSQSSDDAEIKSALRRLVRRYYGKTRAGHTDVEEALRFLNHASHILGDPERRAQYDADLMEREHAESTLTLGGIASEVDAKIHGLPDSEDDSVTAPGAPFEKPAHVPADATAIRWSAQLAELRRTRAGQLTGLLVSSIVFLLAWYLAVPSDGAIASIKLTLLGVTGIALVAGAVAIAVHLLSKSIWNPPELEGPITIVEGMIPRWRRDRTVFVGTGAPVEDATWLFRLRMAELQRVSAERVSDPRPPMRLLARLFDYALWSLPCLGVLALLGRIGPLGGFAQLLAHPLVAPVFVSASWMPIEALLLSRLQTTPGRWLMCVYLHYQVSNPYSPEEVPFTFEAAFRRAVDVWWTGCVAWLPVVGLVAMARARERLGRSGETAWDSRRDCLVTHGPVGTLSMVALAMGLVAAALAWSGRWVDPQSDLGGHWIQALTASRQATTAPAPAPAVVPAAPPAGETPGPVASSQPRISRIDDVTPAVAPDSGKAPATATESAGPAPVPAPEPARPLPPAVPRTPTPAAPASRSAESAASVASAPAARPPAQPAPVAAAPGKAPAPEAAPAKSQPAAAAPAPAEKAPAAASAAPVLSPIEQREQRSQAFARQAQKQQAAGDFSGLVKTCEKWADDDWRNARAYYCAGIGLQGLGQHKKAIAMFNRAGELVPKNDPLKTLIADAVLKSFRADSER